MPRRSGFTLVELLIAISIIAILSTVGLASYTSIQKNARDARRKDDLRAIKVALEVYYQKNGQYPTTSDWVFSSASQPWIPLPPPPSPPQPPLPPLVPDYIARLPLDPINSGGRPMDNNGYTYAYQAASGCGSFQAGQFFALVAQLENKQDNQRNEVQNYKWCNGQSLRDFYGWSPYSFVITSE